MQACPPVSRAEPPPGLSLPHEDMPVPCISEDDYKALCSIAEIKKGSKLKPIPADGLGLQCREHLATTWAEENNISMPTLFDGVRVYRSLTDAEDKRHARILFAMTFAGPKSTLSESDKAIALVQLKSELAPLVEDDLETKSALLIAISHKMNINKPALRAWLFQNFKEMKKIIKKKIPVKETKHEKPPVVKTQGDCGDTETYIGHDDGEVDTPEERKKVVAVHKLGKVSMSEEFMCHLHNFQPSIGPSKSRRDTGKPPSDGLNLRQREDLAMTWAKTKGITTSMCTLSDGVRICWEAEDVEQRRHARVFLAMSHMKAGDSSDLLKVKAELKEMNLSNGQVGCIFSAFCFRAGRTRRAQKGAA